MVKGEPTIEIALEAKSPTTGDASLSFLLDDKTGVTLADDKRYPKGPV